MPRRTLHEPPNLITLQFLVWVAARERNYGETMDAWRSTCPRLSVWEDAVRGGLVRISARGTMREASVALSARGRHLLKANPRAAGRRHIGQADLRT